MSNDNIRELIHDPGHVLMSDVLKGTVSDQNDVQLPFSPIVYLTYSVPDYENCLRLETVDKTIVTVVGTFLSVTYDKLQKDNEEYCELEFKTFIDDAIDLEKFSKTNYAACNFGINLSEDKTFEMSESKIITAIRLSNLTNGYINVLLRLE